MIIATVITVGILGGAASLGAPHVRTSSLVLALSLVLVLVFSAGLVTFGSGEEKKERRTVPTAADRAPGEHLRGRRAAVAQFQAKEFTVPAGINEIEYVDKGGTHTLVFSDPTLNYFELAGPAGPDQGQGRARGRARTTRSTARSPVTAPRGWRRP